MYSIILAASISAVVAVAIYAVVTNLVIKTSIRKRREVVESYIKRLKEMEDIALSYPGVMKTYAIQAGRELRVIVGADKLSDQESEGLSHDIAKKIQDEMTYPGQVKITVIRETRAVSYAK